MMQTTVYVDPNIARVLARGQGKDFVNLLRRSTRQNAKPALAAAKARVPIKSGRLRDSLAIMGMTTPSKGTVSAYIAPRSEFSFRDQRGLKRLVVSNRTKAGKIEKARAKNIQIDRDNPFLYGYGIETGKRQDGSLARKKGAVKYLEKGAETGSTQFTQGVTRDAYEFIITGSTSV